MAAEYESLEQQRAAQDFNVRREQDARGWNNQAMGGNTELDSSADGGFHPRGVVTDAEIERNLSELDGQANSTPMAENVTKIEDHPGFNRVEATSAPEQKQAVQEVGEVLAAEALHPLEEAQKSIELMEKIASNPDTFQSNAIELIHFMSTPGLSNNSREKLSSLLLSQLQNPSRAIDLESTNDYLSALAQLKGEKSDLWQSTLRTEGERVLQAKFDFLSNKRVVPAAPVTPIRATTEAVASPAMPAATEADAVVPEQPKVEQAVAQQPKAEQPVVQQAGAEVVATEPVVEQAAKQPEVEENTEQLKAELESEQEKFKKLTLDIQSAWRDLPQSAQNSLDLSRLPKTAGFLDLNSYRSQLEQRMDNSDLRANSEYAGLSGDGLAVELARQKKINEEFVSVSRSIEAAKLHSPEMKKGTQELDAIRERYAKHQDKMKSKVEKYIVNKPWLVDYIKFDPHVQKNPYYSRFGQNELRTNQ